MIAKVKADFFDREVSLVRVAGDTVDLPEERIDEINSAFPGTLEKEKRIRKKKDAV